MYHSNVDPVIVHVPYHVNPAIFYVSDKLMSDWRGRMYKLLPDYSHCINTFQIEVV